MKLCKYALVYAVCMSIGLCDSSADCISANIDTLNIENEAVRYVMASSNAQFGTTRCSIPQKLFDESRPYRPDRPMGKTIEFVDATAKEVQIRLFEDKECKKIDFVGKTALENGKGSWTFTNLLPGKTYHYEVSTLDGRIVSMGDFATTGQVRMIAIDGGFNIRDLGGWKGLGETTIKYGWLYRGGSLGGTDKDGNKSELPIAGKSELSRLGVRAQLDLRAKTDGGMYVGEGSLHSYSAGMALMPAMDFNNTMTDYGAYNKDMSVISDVAWIIYELKKGHPVYFNCRQGADRTGTIAFLLEGLLGCYEHSNAAGGNQMALDYELTGFSQANLIDNWKVKTSCRPASEAYSNTAKLFRQIIDLKAEEPGVELVSLQQKCYYYLNRYVNPEWKGETIHIDSADLDWFIVHMLEGMSATTYVSFKPQWAASGANLKTVAEKCATMVSYARDTED